MKGTILYLLAATVIFAAHGSVHEHVEPLQACLIGLMAALGLPGMVASYIAVGRLDDAIIIPAAAVFWLLVLVMSARKKAAAPLPLAPRPQPRMATRRMVVRRRRVMWEDE